MSTKHELLFQQVYESAPFIEFDRSWSNGIGGYSNGINSIITGNGGMKSTKTPGGKKVIIIGTRFGNVFIGEDRMTAEGLVYAVSCDQVIQKTMLVPQAISDEVTMVEVIGDPFNAIRNVGERIEDIISLYKKSISHRSGVIVS